MHTAMAMKNGAKKYGPYNWRSNKVRMTIYIEAAQRHLAALLDGEDKASDSQVHRKPQHA
ncbi:dATP/dGTP diphosphohydrolase domain-containing protein [Bradyrhizobium elkanii]|uniref:dATP/dGTP diphosphohydrolase domain-containing protein n=1 Tax=Bradyrhizobium elkanii TaxID=29448 RepID=UPI003519990E